LNWEESIAFFMTSWASRWETRTQTSAWSFIETAFSYISGSVTSGSWRNLQVLHSLRGCRRTAHAECVAGGSKCSAPEDRSWGVREFQVIDSNGNLLRIGGPAKQTRPPSIESGQS
jgi:hypothetical protein